MDLDHIVVRDVRYEEAIGRASSFRGVHWARLTGPTSPQRRVVARD
jgi:hypothetical protein